EFGQTPFSFWSAQPSQKVHSNEQVRARVDSGGRSTSQHSQGGLSISMTGSLCVFRVDSDAARARANAPPRGNSGQAPVLATADLTHHLTGSRRPVRVHPFQTSAA